MFFVVKTFGGLRPRPEKGFGYVAVPRQDKATNGSGNWQTRGSADWEQRLAAGVKPPHSPRKRRSMLSFSKSFVRCSSSDPDTPETPY